MKKTRKRPKRLTRIRQTSLEHGDCGLACVRMVTGASREKVVATFKRLKKRKNPTVFYTRHGDLMEILRRLKLKPKRHPFRCWHLETHAIIPVNRRKNAPFHWVVYDAARKGVHDPAPRRRALITKLEDLKVSRRSEYIAV